MCDASLECDKSRYQTACVPYFAENKSHYKSHRVKIALLRGKKTVLLLHSEITKNTGALYNCIIYIVLVYISHRGKRKRKKREEKKNR